MELIGGMLKFMTSWFDTQFDHSNVSDVNEMPGSQVGGQRRQILGDAQPRPAIIGAGKRHIRRHSAASGDVQGMPPKQSPVRSNAAQAGRLRQQVWDRSSCPVLASLMAATRTPCHRPGRRPWEVLRRLRTAAEAACNQRSNVAHLRSRECAVHRLPRGARRLRARLHSDSWPGRESLFWWSPVLPPSGLGLCR